MACFLGTELGNLFSGLLQRVGGFWGLSWGPLGLLWALSEVLSGLSWGPFGALRGPLGASWGPLGLSWGPLGSQGQKARVALISAAPLRGRKIAFGSRPGLS